MIRKFSFFIFDKYIYPFQAILLDLYVETCKDSLELAFPKQVLFLQKFHLFNLELLIYFNILIIGCCDVCDSCLDRFVNSFD